MSIGHHCIDICILICGKCEVFNDHKISLHFLGLFSTQKHNNTLKIGVLMKVYFSILIMIFKGNNTKLQR